MAIEYGVVELKLGERDFEVRYGFERGLPASRLEPSESDDFWVESITLVRECFLGHDPVRIDLTRVFDDLGVATWFSSQAYEALLKVQ